MHKSDTHYTIFSEIYNRYRFQNYLRLNQFFPTIIFFQICSSLSSYRTAVDLSNFLTMGISNKVNIMKNKDFKAIHVFNYLISIQLSLK